MTKELNDVGAAYYRLLMARKNGRSMNFSEVETLRLKYEFALARLTDREGLSELLVNIQLTVTGKEQSNDDKHQQSQG